MEYYYRCCKCGKRTPSFSEEHYLDDWFSEHNWKQINGNFYCEHHNENTKISMTLFDKIFTFIALIVLLIALILVFI